MAQLVLRSASLHFGPKLILDKVNLTLDKGERISLVGRNGVGKTTLFRVLLGQTDLDGGEMVTESGLKLCVLPQDVPTDITGKVFDIVAAGLTVEHDEDEWQSQYKVDTVLSVLELDGGRQFSDLSGGLKRRVLLARALVTEPDILLLDEPTNHLDIAAVEWLEHFLKSYEGCVLFITHDRRFLQNVARRIIELDRGVIQSFEGTYDKFLAHKDAQLIAEDRRNAEFDKKLAKEEAWIRQGVKARRTRNEGRVRTLQKLREEFAARKKRVSQADMISAGGEQSGRKVIEAYNISVEFGGKKVIDKFSTLVMRGDKIGILGPNGCGKSTMINAMLGKLPICEGTVKYGTELQIAYFDQMRGQLDDEKSVIDNIAEGSEFVDIAGKQVHIYSYLSRYLFAPDRAREKVKVLSGGERNRCLLAKIMSRPSNLLILDEPTNDLDMDSIELLEELLVDYKGTLVLVSHDRAFLDNVVSSTIAFDHDGSVNQYVGGYEDWLRQRPALPGEVKKVSKKEKDTTKSKAETKSKSKLSFTQRNELDRLPSEIDAKEKEINQMHKVIGQAGFYEQSQDTINKSTEKLAQFEAEHEALFARWEELSGLE